MLHTSGKIIQETPTHNFKGVNQYGQHAPGHENYKVMAKCRLGNDLEEFTGSTSIRIRHSGMVYSDTRHYSNERQTSPDQNVSH